MKFKYGDPLTGIWNCTNAKCNFEIFPIPLKEKHKSKQIEIFVLEDTAYCKCPKCSALLIYDEEG